MDVVLGSRGSVGEDASRQFAHGQFRDVLKDDLFLFWYGESLISGVNHYPVPERYSRHPRWTVIALQLESTGRRLVLSQLEIGLHNTLYPLLTPLRTFSRIPSPGRTKRSVSDRKTERRSARLGSGVHWPEHPPKSPLPCPLVCFGWNETRLTLPYARDCYQRPLDVSRIA